MNFSGLQRVGEVQVGFITDAAWSPDGSTLAVSGGGGVYVWRGGFSGEPDVQIMTDAPVKAIAFSPDSRMIAAASADTAVRLYAADDGRVLSVIRGHSDSVGAVAFSPDGRFIASAGGDTHVQVISLTTGARTLLRGHTNEVTSLAFSPDGRFVVSGGWDASVYVWETAGGERIATLPHEDWVRDLVIFNKMLATACKDGVLRLWDISTWACVAEVEAHDVGVDALAVHPNTRWLVTGGRDHRAHLWDVPPDTAPEKMATLAAHTKPVLATALHPGGEYLATGGGDNRVVLWQFL